MQIRYQCIECGRKYETSSKIMYVCPVCSAFQTKEEPVHGVLRVLLPYDDLKKSVQGISFNIKDLLPIEDHFMPDYPVGNTPLMKSDKIAVDTGYHNLYFKDETRNPTGSVKDRASVLVAGFARQNNKNKVVVASTGNIAASMAAVSAAAGLECITFVPKTISRSRLVQIMIYGAKVVCVDGSYDDAFNLAIEYSEKYAAVCRNNAYNPFTIEGEKTVGFEIFQQLDYSVPDYIFVPTADGTMLSSIYKGFYDLFQFDWLPEMPKLVAVQVDGHNSIVNAIRTGKIENTSDNPTIADSLDVKVSRNAFLALKDLDSTCGLGVSVNDRELIYAQKYLAENLGVFVEPAGAASYAGFLRLKSFIDKKEKVVFILSANGLKNVNQVSQNIQFPEPIPPELSAVPEDIY